MDALEIIDAFYPEDTPLRRLLLRHSEQVRGKALALMETPVVAAMGLNWQLISDGCLLHDIGIFRCHAPSILCMGTEPYLAHGIIGAALLRDYGRRHGLDLEDCARICERHTGAGLTAQDIAAEGLTIPIGDYVPETAEEQLVCLADKFFSKSSPEREKSLESIRRSMARFGDGPRSRLEQMCRRFGLIDG